MSPQEARKLRAIYHNVGHGQAIHIFGPRGDVIVIDLGSSRDFSPLTWLRGETDTIDYLIVTHPHGDHIEEMPLISKLGFKVRQFWRPKWLSEQDVYKQNQSAYRINLEHYFEMSKRYSHKVSEHERVGNPDVSGGLSVKVFSSRSCGTSNINNHSGVAFVEYASSGLLIPGDNEPPSWRALLQQPGFLAALRNVDIFMASHHGRASGYCPDIFVNKPRLCLVSDGRVQDTDARSRYSAQADGWKVHYRDGAESETRYCLTTRTDGYIQVDAGLNSSNPYLSVRAD